MQILIKDEFGKVVKTVDIEPPKSPVPEQFRTMRALLRTIEANLSNERLSDKGFRQFIRNSLKGVVITDEESKAKSG